MHGAEGRAHVDEDGQVPHRPVEIEQQPEHQEEGLAVREAVGPHGARVVEAVEEGEGGPAAAARDVEQEELARAPDAGERPHGHVQHARAVGEQRRRVALDDHADEDGPHVVQHAVLGGRAAGELPHLPQAVELHDRLGAVGARLRRRQALLVDLAVGQPRQLLDALEEVRHHVGHEALLAMVPQRRRHRRHHVGHELVLVDRDHGGLHVRVRAHGRLHLAQLDAGAPDLDHGVAAAHDLEVAFGRPLAKVARAHRALAAQSLHRGQEGLRRLLRQLQVARGQAGAGDADLAHGLRAHGPEAEVQHGAALARVRPAGAHVPLVRRAVVDVLRREHADLRDVALLRAAVARVEDAGLTVAGPRQRGQHTVAEFRRHCGAAHTDVAHGLGQALLQEDVQHGGHEARVRGAVALREGLELVGLHDVGAALREVEAAAADDHGREEVVQEGHPGRRVVAERPRAAGHALGLAHAHDEGREVAVGEDDALGPAGGAAGEEHDRGVVLVQGLLGELQGRAVAVGLEEACVHKHRLRVREAQGVPRLRGLRLRERQRRAGVLGHLAHAVGGPVHVHRHDREARLQDAQEGRADGLAAAHVDDHRTLLVGVRLGQHRAAHGRGPAAELRGGEAEAVAGHGVGVGAAAALGHDLGHREQPAARGVAVLLEVPDWGAPGHGLLQGAGGHHGQLPDVAVGVRRAGLEEHLEGALLLGRAPDDREVALAVRPHGPLAGRKGLAVPGEDELRGLARAGLGAQRLHGPQFRVHGQEQLPEAHLRRSGLHADVPRLAAHKHGG
mmetsp:Transcript_105480/g.340191  ORF Transcript_105480/g.340191 Transcript_105480/m.340191 type:complete len:788 (-) Transcript_105480:29-2392(-)